MNNWLAAALKLAHRAQEQNEVPIGAVVVLQDEIVGEGWNQPITTNDPTAHAEIIALREAAKNIGNYRLIDTTLYVTIEPCVMCIGAMVHARIKKLIYGADDPKAGAVKSMLPLLDFAKFNHQIVWEGGVMAVECASLLQNFFKKRRKLAISSN